MRQGKVKNKNSRGVEIEDHLLTATEKEAAKMEKPMGKKPLGVFWGVVVIVFFVLAVRIFYLNVIRGSYYQEAARENQVRSLVVLALRGRIFDRSGTALVNNVPSVDAVIIPADLPREAGEEENLINALSEVFKMNEGEIRGKMGSAGHSSLDPVLLKENISQEEMLVLLEKKGELPGIVVQKNAMRDYVDGLIFSHLLGYEGRINRKEFEGDPGYLMTDYIGKQGLEKSYEGYLKGTHGALQVEVDSKGTIKKELGVVNSKPGGDLITSIDAKLQKKLFDSLGAILEKTETKTAAAVALNPTNGEVLALVSLPSFDNNLFARGASPEEYSRLVNDPASPLFNRVIAGEYPPGSILKPLVALAGLSEGTISEESTVNCRGGISIGGYHFGDWKAHGAVDVRKAIAESCDVFFYAVGGGYGSIESLGIERMKKYENLFGLGEKTGIDIPGESDGFIPDEKWKLEKFGENWYTGNSYHAAIGQGYITVTPLQLASYISTVANGGIFYKPRLVTQIRKSEGEIINPSPEIIGKDFVSPEIVKIIQEGMRQSVTGGTAYSLSDLPVAVAGKTGTAQFGAENKTHAWFVSYAPYENPEIAVAVLVEGGGEGTSSAVPVTKDIYQWYFGGGR